jgi:hypothetical protein
MSGTGDASGIITLLNGAFRERMLFRAMGPVFGPPGNGPGFVARFPLNPAPTQNKFQNRSQGFQDALRIESGPAVLILPSHADWHFEGSTFPF